MEDQELKHLAPSAQWLFFINSFIRFAVLFLTFGLWIILPTIAILNSGGANGSSLSGVFVLLGILVVIVASWFWAKLSYNNYKYQLTPNGFRKEQGVIWKKYVTIPYSKIQNVDIYRGVLARILGLSDLNIQTAGASAVMNQRSIFSSGMGAEGRLLGLSFDDAEKLRDELVSLSEESKVGL